MNVVYLSIGTNIGERLRNLQDAVRLLAEHPAVQVDRVSSIYETDPVGFVDQDAFLNIAVKVTTTLSAAEMLTTCQAVESELGRVRLIRWGPRSIDLDILLFNHENIETESLIVPHERMYERAFVLVPLMEISELETSQLRFAHEQYSQMDIEKEGIRLWKKVNAVEEFERFES